MTSPMIQAFYRAVALTALFTLTAGFASAQIAFSATIPHAEDGSKSNTETPEPFGYGYDGHVLVPQLLTLDLDETPEEFFPPQSTLIIPGSGTIPNSEFLRRSLRVMGFEAPVTPYVILDNLTHSSVELYAYDDLIGFLENQPDGSVFIIGLDFHAGFIRKDAGELTFLQSKTGAAPTAEALENAAALKDSDVFIIGDLSTRARILVGVDAI